MQIENSMQCPYCHGYARRIRRRRIDRLISLVKPVARFECQNHVCQWVGNIYQDELPNRRMVLRR